ncbi:hypothetical protein QYE76_041569 [Lolium multiflorum]|uniref:Uncharacterized protein n=1 Tax=Lolium multiflorum TaxID=4521 RepID=A0AAD8TE38_LOLMU|nr:hypothetical protein QYE76_041569 [Lolium multiflorum]
MVPRASPPMDVGGGGACPGGPSRGSSATSPTGTTRHCKCRHGSCSWSPRAAMAIERHAPGILLLGLLLLAWVVGEVLPLQHVVATLLSGGEGRAGGDSYSQAMAASSSASGTNHLRRASVSGRHRRSTRRRPRSSRRRTTPEEFPGLRQAQLESFATTDEFGEAWSAADHHCAEEERSRRLSLVINLDSDDDTGQSSRPHRRCDDAGQCCSYLPQPKKEEPSDEDEDYAAAMYRRLELGRGGNDDSY